MKTIYFICDESGAKGYSDKQEQYLGETGVMAGFIIPLENIDEVRTDLDAISQKFTSTGKLHITDIPPDDQEKLRNEIFNYLIIRKIPCLYEAIYSQGFYEHSESIKEIKRNIKKQRKSNIKLSGNPTKELLHEQLFQATFGKAIAFCLDYVGKTIKINVITDRIEESILKQFNKAVDTLLNFSAPTKIKKTGFDPQKGKVVKGEICSSMEVPDKFIDEYSGISFSIECEDTSLTLAADIIANSLHYHFKEKSNSSVGDSLNTCSAITGHPLEKIMYGVWDDTKQNYYADALFEHPGK
jgi:hypothetical protein